jgi:hypothetical protein
LNRISIWRLGNENRKAIAAAAGEILQLVHQETFSPSSRFLVDKILLSSKFIITILQLKLFYTAGKYEIIIQIRSTDADFNLVHTIEELSFGPAHYFHFENNILAFQMPLCNIKYIYTVFYLMT